MTAPAECPGVTAVMVVLLVTTVFEAVIPPNVTLAPATKFDPLMVTEVPPLTDPEFGTTPVTDGGGPGGGAE